MTTQPRSPGHGASLHIQSRAASGALVVSKDEFCSERHLRALPASTCWDAPTAALAKGVVGGSAVNWMDG